MSLQPVLSLIVLDLMLGSIYENDGKPTFCRFIFVFSKRNTKQRVSGSSFWFENEIVDVVLSNRFRKQNVQKISCKNDVFKFKKNTRQSQIFFGRKCCFEMFSQVGCKK